MRAFPTFLCVASCLALAAPVVRAQSATDRSTVTGRVLDEEDHQPLPNARLGIYRIPPVDSPGTYRLIIAYQPSATNVLDDLALKAGETRDFLVTLTPKPLQIQGVDIKGTESRGSEATSLSKQKKASFVSDAITSEQIAKSTD